VGEKIKNMIVGLAGKSCSGKNVAAEILVKKGWVSVDLDHLSHNILNDLSSEAAALFGREILTSDGKVDRKLLGQIVFGNPEELSRLEHLIYPELHNRLDEILAARTVGSPPFLLNAALLEKNDFWKKCDCILWVDAPYFIRLIRALKRDGKPLKELIGLFRIQAKLKPQYFFQRVDIYTIKNGGNRKTLEKRLDRWLKNLPPE
jgi:dephospho-CoA kinase